MPSTLTPGKTIVQAFTAALVDSNTVAKGGTLVVTTDWEGELAVKLGRIAATTAASGIEMSLQRSGRAAADDFWVKIVPFTTANHATAPSIQPLASNAAAGALSVQLSAATGFSVADGQLFLYNSAVPGNSEWCTHILSVTSPNITLLDSLTRAQTAAVAYGSDQAEEWNIPVALSCGSNYRFVVDTAKNSVGFAVVVEAVLHKMKTIDAT